MPRVHRHYGWQVSPYSAKTRSYLRYVGVPFEDVAPSVWTLYRKIQGAVGRLVMPTVELADGGWLQDSSAIIDYFEGLPGADPERSVTPAEPCLAVASSLLEVFADEWLPMADLHYRWNLPANADFALGEFARDGFPRLPESVGRRLAAPVARRMASYLPALGIEDATIPGLERTVEQTIAALEATLAARPFVLGGRPCLGDFALYGPLWAHLYRDPASRRLFDAAPAVVDWMQRLTEPGGVEAQGPFEDAVPPELDPLIQRIVDDQLAWNRTLIAKIDEYCAAHPAAKRVPRALGLAPFAIAERRGRRKLITFVQWKAQRTRDAYERAEGAADAWLSRFGDDPTTIIPAVANPFELVEFRAVLRDRR
ncbi:glutathione S-transferase [Plesiocystis pacifica SIR-1]|uniref:Glutathione S-transferase n=1 Tax=Plesiocystis pacifica SIR-1 TaxID=391625 RepID=A6GFJ2_9BACT|nr:glutathione S-transferase family protein [Plesiocystis pacifica]EDM75364.1 glutathione S-transferase [Plesiocystis pacifica SIR-1]